MVVFLSLLGGAGWQFFDNNGNPLSGGLIYTYVAGTTTPQATYADNTGTQTNPNPIVLDSAGRTPNEVWLTQGAAYKFAIQTSLGVSIRTWDNLSGVIDSAQLSGTAGSSYIGFTQAGANAVARTAQDKLREVVSVKDFGAVGDGLTDDTLAVQRAINTGKSIVGVAGETYLIGPLTQSTAGQVFDFTGCTLKRVNASTHAAMLSVNGARATVKGGRWDGNKANQSGTVNEQYAQAAVTIFADYCVVEQIESVNSWGIGIKGVDCSYASIRFNKCLDSELFGIYVEGVTVDEYGNEILDNYVASTGIVNASGIYLTGTSNFLINQYFWKVCRNTVQLSQNAAVTGICITTRGYDGVCGENNTTGGTMGISGDSATRTTFSGNRCSDTSGLSDYGIEINASLCTVVGNAIENTKWGISISGAVFNQNYTTVSGNVINPRNGGIGVYALGQVNGVKTITAASSTNPIQFTSASHGLSGGIKNISGATSANPISFTTSSPHYFTNGDSVLLAGLPGSFAALNGTAYTITVTGANTFTVAVNGSAFAAYTSGGTATPTQNFVTFTELPGNFSALNGISYPVTVTGANTFTVAVNGAAFAAYTSGGKALRGVAQYLNITGNTIKFNAPNALGNGGACIYLAGSTEYSTISGNLFVGCGSTIPSGIGVYLDNTPGYCSILGNKFSGLSEPVTLYAGAPRTFTDISFNANDLTYDCPAPGSILTASGSATIGARVTQMFNATSGGVQTNILDTATLRQFSFSDGVTTPEGNINAGLGSLYSNYGYGEGNTLYIKETGAGTTGWIPVGYAYATAAQIADKTNAINTLRKRVGRSVWDTTNNRLMIAVGGADTSRWYVCDGSAFVTPA